MTLRIPAFNDAKTYGFEWLRYLAELANLQEGVLGATDLKVTAAAGGGMKVDIAAGAGFVKGDSGTPAVGLSQGLFMVVNDAAIANAVTVTAAHATLPRIDQIALRVRDSSDLVTGADDATFVVVTGTATSGATLDNRTGAAALPSDHLRLADLLIPAASTQTTAGNTRDRRPWARGAFSRIKRISADYTTASVSMVDVDATNLALRIECSGVPLRTALSTRVSNDIASAGLQMQMSMDAAQADDARAATFQETVNKDQTGRRIFDLTFTPAAGSHLFKPQYMVLVGGTVKLLASAGNGLHWEIEELVSQDANNGTA